MIIWLLVLLLLLLFIYVVYHMNFMKDTPSETHEDEQHYTFKI